MFRLSVQYCNNMMQYSVLPSSMFARNNYGYRVEGDKQSCFHKLQPAGAKRWQSWGLLKDLCIESVDITHKHQSLEMTLPQPRSRGSRQCDHGTQFTLESVSDTPIPFLRTWPVLTVTETREGKDMERGHYKIARESDVKMEGSVQDERQENRSP